jgi:hypothetical protein
MKAISLWQPHASLWLTDRKIHETRPRRWNHSGWLAVHAAKRIVTDRWELGDELVAILEVEFGSGWATSLPCGGVIGAINMVSCLPMTETVPAHADDERCGNWAPGRYALRRTDVIKLREKIPFRGQQTLFALPDNISMQILNPAMAA